MSHNLTVTTRQAVILMETVAVELTNDKLDRADLIELHDIHQQLQYALVYEGRLSEATPELEPPIR